MGRAAPRHTAAVTDSSGAGELATAAPAAAGRALTFRAANVRELAAWDDLTVHPGGGHVLQSRAWAEHWAARGSEPRFLVGSDGSAVLALVRRFPIVGGAGAYLPRGPVPAGDLEAMVDRTVAATAWLTRAGVAVVATDAEVPASSGYGPRLVAAGFRQIEELQASRHRISLALGRSADEAAVFAGIARATRQRIRKAEAAGIVVVRHDAFPGATEAAGEGFRPPEEAVEAAFDRFFDLLAATGERLHFSFGSRPDALAWWRSAHAVGHLVLLEARAPDGDVLAGLLLYRHGGRLSTVHSGDRVATRRSFPGALHLLRWRAIQLALREGRAEMDLGGVDAAGARREPVEGDPMWGLYQHKLSFGGRWLELAGAHERIERPARYLAGRIAGRIARPLGVR